MFRANELEDDAFIIAEVGQNHQGDLEKALEYIKIFAGAGADAVKFQTRNNRYLFSDASYAAPYTSENAFAETYGAHREALELDIELLPQIKQAGPDKKGPFVAPRCDEPSLELLADLDVDILKIASFDLGNLPLINRMAKT